MASRIIHLAIIEQLKNKIEIKDINRLRLGVILPDAYNGETSTSDSHLKIETCNGTKKTYNLEYFRSKFGEKMKTDDLYLGYYLHLIQDMSFRHFVYDVHQWNPMISGNVERLHNDYHLINTYLINEYKLNSNIVIPLGFENEDINELYNFDIDNQINEIKSDFRPYAEGEIFFFTKEMAEQFIKEAVEVCEKEVTAIFNNGELADQEMNAWAKM